MAGIEFGSLEKDIGAFLKIPPVKKEVQAEVDKVMLGGISFGAGTSDRTHTPEEAANKFIEVLKDEIQSASLTDNVKQAILQGIVHDKPYQIGENEYSVHVYWESDLSRLSLNPSGEDLRDLAELYNTGVDHTMRQIFGMWNGQKVGSRTVIPGTHFMEIALATFMDAYGAEYGVESMTYTREQ